MELGTTKGEVGDLEWLFESASTPHALILCHPHPLYGGSMLDGVLEIAAQVAKSQNISTIRFNFRGVGASTGSYDQGIGEVADLASVVKEFETRFEKITLSGYSFGAGVVLKYAADSSDNRDLLLIAPPTQNGLPELTNNVQLVVGDNDPISELSVLSSWVQRNPDRSLHVIEDADHFLAMFGLDLVDVLKRALQD
ncbi:MAG: hypothetical protein J4G19_07895 [Pseudomonadales bacterium]|nr:hypothetical protein [Pseudomonadales bacterium]